MLYSFEWDPAKANINSNKHNVSFEEAATTFKDPSALTLYDEKHSVEEDRYITMGFSSSAKLLITIHTFNEVSEDTCIIRIISSRKATKTEQSNYTRG